MPTHSLLHYSLLDLVPVREGGDTVEALSNSLDLAQHAEAWGYRRFWLAEHHNMPGIASSATAVVIGHIAAGTKTIRVGSGGIMLPNHAPLTIAEQFGTLASLFPDRIDLGLGRAPGGDQAVTQALRRGLGSNGDTFPDDVMELQAYFNEDLPPNGIQAVPGRGLNVPLYLLGSSTFGAQLAAHLGLPYAFASHFAPRELLRAIYLYRKHFQPSKACPEPYLMVAIGAYVAETDHEARRLFSTMQQQFLHLIRGTPGKVPPPVDHIDRLWYPNEKEHIEAMTRYCLVGSEETVEQQLQRTLDETQPNEIIVTSQIYDHQARLNSFQRMSNLLQRLTR